MGDPGWPCMLSCSHGPLHGLRGGLLGLSSFDLVGWLEGVWGHGKDRGVGEMRSESAALAAQQERMPKRTITLPGVTPHHMQSAAPGFGACARQ